MQARIEVRALATAIRDFRPADRYADDEARFRRFQLCNVAALAVYGNDRCTTNPWRGKPFQGREFSD